MSGTSKKMIVPVVALMLCVVALAGVAFAYVTTTATNTGNTVVTNQISINLHNGEEKGAGIFNVSDVFVDYGTITEDGIVTGYVADKGEGVELGSATLEIKSENAIKDGKTFSVKMSYEVESDSVKATDLKNISFQIKIGDKVYDADKAFSMVIPADEKQISVTVTLLASWDKYESLNGETTSAAAPTFPDYKITFTATETENVN